MCCTSEMDIPFRRCNAKMPSLKLNATNENWIRIEIDLFCYLCSKREMERERE